jgi:hypothetical protein
MSAIGQFWMSERCPEARLARVFEFVAICPDRVALSPMALFRAEWTRFVTASLT